MSFEAITEQPNHFDACIKVIGVGGGGGNAVEHMIDNQAQGITFIAANTDKQALSRSRANIVIPLGKTGLGAGAKPEVGAMAAQEAADKIREAVAGVTKPFEFEGSRRMRQAQAGIENLKDKVDSLIVILNDKLEDEVGGQATMVDCFAAADDVLYKACNGIAEIIHTPGIINVDFEDLRTVMSERGTAMMGTATASGPDRAREAAEKAIACPLLEGANLQGARGLLVYVTASAETMTNPEIREVMSVMKNFVSRDANQIIGTAFDNDMGDELRVTVIATGLDDDTGRHTPEAGQGGLGSSIYGRGPQVFSQPAFGQAPAQQAVPQAPIQQTFGYGYTQPVREPQSAPAAQPQFAPQTNDPALQQPQTVHQPAPQPQQHLSDDWARTAPQDKPQQSEASATPFVSVPTFIRHR